MNKYYFVTLSFVEALFSHSFRKRAAAPISSITSDAPPTPHPTHSYQNDKTIHIHPEDGKCNICRNVGKYQHETRIKPMKEFYNMQQEILERTNSPAFLT
jgi:hypothetical protein